MQFGTSVPGPGKAAAAEAGGADPKIPAECAIGDQSGNANFYAKANCGETSSMIRRHSQIDAKLLPVRVSTLDLGDVKGKRTPLQESIKIWRGDMDRPAILARPSWRTPTPKIDLAGAAQRGLKKFL